MGDYKKEKKVLGAKTHEGGVPKLYHRRRKN